MKSSAATKAKRRQDSRSDLVLKLSRQMVALEKLNYEALADQAEDARLQYEELREEATRLARQRNEAKARMTELTERLREIDPKYQKALTGFEKILDQALVARCGDLKRVPPPQRSALEFLVTAQRQRDHEHTVAATLERIRRADTMADALRVVRISAVVKLPEQREDEWTLASGDFRVCLLAAWLPKLQGGPLTKIQDAIVNVGSED